MIQTTDDPSVGTFAPQGLRTALLVEDEPLVAMLTQDNLREIGFEPLWVTSGGDALRYLRNDPALAPELAVIDVGLPDMRGDDLAQQIRRDHPGLGIILATGHEVAALRIRFSGDGRIVVLGKPYMAADLAQSAHAVTRA